MPLRRGELDAADIRLGEGVVGGVAVGSELAWSRPGVMAYAEPDGLVFREGVQAMPSTFTRASQAWDGSGLVAPDTMRVFGRDTKSPVVLIEGQRTNYVQHSANLGIGSWILHSASRTNDTSIINPFGEAGAWFFAVNSSADGYAQVARSVPVAEGEVNTLSVYAKRGTSTGVTLIAYSGTTFGTANYNFDTSVLTVTGSTATGNVQVLSGGWVRITMSATITSSQVSFIMRPYTGNLPDTVDGSVGAYFWGPQLEHSAFASSYIPTDGAPATRAQDNFFVDLPPIGVDEPLTWNFALRGQVSRGEGVMTLREAGGGTISPTTPLLLFVNRGGGTYDVYSYGGGSGAYLGLMVGVTEPRLYPITIVTTATHVYLYVDGSLVGVAESTRQFTVGRTFVGSSGTSTGERHNLYAPGAAQLGIPFIDNRAWSAEEIQAAHARWLPELQKIEVPV